MIRWTSLLLFASCSPCLADTSLDALRNSLASMRTTISDSVEVRGATPQLTIAKHQLRDWVESHLTELPENGDEAHLANKLNAELRAARLFCTYVEADQLPCPDQNFLGLLAELKLRRSAAFLILQTGLGIVCGFDESAYMYSWTGGTWRRIWQTEQNTYTKDAYQPQNIESVLVSPYSKPEEAIVLTLGTQPWCESNWRDVYYRAFFLKPDRSAKPLIEGSAWAYLSQPVLGSVAQDDVLVEFSTGTIDGGFPNRRAVRHYKIDGNNAQRIDPIALSPRDFVDEWLTHPWTEAALWSEPANKISLLARHRELHKDPLFGEFLSPTMHCPAAPDLWQVGIEFSDAQDRTVYFKVRWRPPYHFTMVEVRDQPWHACTEKDPDADEPRTLFAGQDQR